MMRHLPNILKVVIAIILGITGFLDVLAGLSTWGMTDFNGVPNGTGDHIFHALLIIQGVFQIAIIRKLLWPHFTHAVALVFGMELIVLSSILLARGYDYVWGYGYFGMFTFFSVGVGIPYLLSLLVTRKTTRHKRAS